mmetsp:Transcript_24367/g.57932  ORF Transcript_24367/g.57932 Transcript_24367/m.57932 type:complete len:695 (+) Transcript_24367:219-2303(+)
MSTPHHHSQHTLALTNCQSNENVKEVIGAFQRTSDLPCETWADVTGTLMLVSNYEHCLLEDSDWVVLAAGFCYRYQGAFGGQSELGAERLSFAQTVLRYCRGTNSFLEEDLARRLRRCSGHFSLHIIRKGILDDNGRVIASPRLWVFNDPFGFMPVYFARASDADENAYILTSSIDCIKPLIEIDGNQPQLDWDIVAEYLVFGTTLGGKNTGSQHLFDRTMYKNISNLGPGCYFKSPIEGDTKVVRRYVQCYGALEEKLHEERCPPAKNKSTIYSQTNPSSRPRSIRGVQVAPTTKSPPMRYSKHSPKRPDTEVMFQFIKDCVEEARSYIHHVALTGGGDTRLLLACLLALQAESGDAGFTSDLVFQTHSQQSTDLLIARHLAKLFKLKHTRVTPLERSAANLHNTAPLRRKRSRLACFSRKSDEVEYSLHGRFGTEFLGCLCFYKSPLDVRGFDEIEQLRCDAEKWFTVIFGSAAESLQNPVDTLMERYEQLEQDKGAVEGMDAAYAFQLQLYTRCNLSDIYGGLRKGSWFSIPSTQFTRNQITPFLDNRLLHYMLNLTEAEKHEPYELYGKLYQSGVIPQMMLEVPSNNKLLTLHTQIPRAVKKSESRVRVKMPCFNVQDNAELRDRFQAVFWNGAKAFSNAHSSASIDPKEVSTDSRTEICALTSRVGPEAACRLSERLESFMLFCNRDNK